MQSRADKMRRKEWQRLWAARPYVVSFPNDFLHTHLQNGRSHASFLNAMMKVCNNMATQDLKASIHFLAHNELYRTEKPYSLRYMGEEQVAQTNIELDKHDDIPIHDIRGWEREFSLQKQGFTISRLSSRMQYRDYSDPGQVIAIYLHEVASHLKKLLGARHVQIYEHLVRYS